MKRQALFFIFFTTLLLSNITYGQQRVAIVLSGGGAKGLAYIGALKALEENGIPIDYIVGTSMGGLVGGFYAAGYSPKEMEELVVSQRFQNWVKGELEEGDKISIFQQDKDPSIVNFRVGYDTLSSTSIKANTLIKDHCLRLALMDELSKASAKAHNDFDSLVIPFRCVTSEIFMQKEVVISKGNLNEALRATMAVPLFFSPQKIDEVYLFDGGLYNNFPVNTTKKIFKPDVVLGFNVSDKVFSEYPYKDAERMVDTRLLSYLLLSRSDTIQLDSEDVYIQPDLQAYSSMEFAEAQGLIDAGYKSTMEKMPRIKAAVSARRDSLYYDQRRAAFIEGEKEYDIDRVEVRGFKNAGELEKFFKPDTAGHYPMKAIRNGYFILEQSTAYDHFAPYLTYDESTSKYQFHLNLKHNKDLKIGLGGVISNRPISYLFLSVEKDFFFRRRHNFYSNGYIGVFYISNYTRARVYFHTYRTAFLEGSFTYNKWDYYQTSNLLLLRTENQSVLKQNEINFKLSLKKAVRKKGILGVSAAYVDSESNYSIISSLNSGDTLSYSRIHMFQGRAEYENSKLDRIQYASKGYFFHVDLNYYAGLELFEPGTLEKQITGLTWQPGYRGEAARSWVAFQLQLGKFFRLHKRYTVGVFSQNYFSTQPLFFNHKATAFYAKPFMPIMDSYTLYYEDFRSSNFIAGGLVNIVNLRKNLDFRIEAHPFYNFLPVRFNAPTGGSGVDKQYYNSTPELKFIAAGGLVYHFMLGPISVQATYYDTKALGKSKFGFVVHAGFLLRNKRWDD
ncbi:MAG: patatin [Chitinophagaceae bacterium]|nr:patatin [Chitinophagaceae bacterium]